MKVDTINITEYANDAVLGVHSFSNDEVGVREAEEYYKAIILEHQEDATESEMDVYIEDGYYEQSDYQVFLTHSTPPDAPEVEPEEKGDREVAE